MKIIKSLELLLYELMVWLVFYPLTLWKSVTSPLKLMQYADSELDDTDEDRYSDALSPPIFLAITLGLMHLVEIAARLEPTAEGLLSDDKNLIAFRLVVFAIFPLFLSIQLLRTQGIKLDRSALRRPFYAQCFVAAPFAMLFDTAILLRLAGTQPLLSTCLILLAISWYLGVQASWFKQEAEVSLWSGFAKAVIAFIAGVVVLLILSSIVVRL